MDETQSTRIIEPGLMVRGRGDRDNHLIWIKQLGDSLYESEAADSTKETGKDVVAFSHP